MKTSFAKRIEARKKQILKRLASSGANRFTRCFSNPDPVLASNSVKYELAARAQAINYAGVTAMLNNNSDKKATLPAILSGWPAINSHFSIAASSKLGRSWPAFWG